MQFSFIKVKIKKVLTILMLAACVPGVIFGMQKTVEILKDLEENTETKNFLSEKDLQKIEKEIKGRKEKLFIFAQKITGDTIILNNIKNENVNLSKKNSEVESKILTLIGTNKTLSENYNKVSDIEKSLEKLAKCSLEKSKSSNYRKKACFSAFAIVAVYGVFCVVFEVVGGVLYYYRNSIWERGAPPA